MKLPEASKRLREKFGIFGGYTARTYLEDKHRPRYHISERLGGKE